jgi:hypothetical protein
MAFDDVDPDAYHAGMKFQCVEGQVEQEVVWDF